MGKWTKRIVYALIVLAVVVMVAVLALQYVQGSVLRGLTNGQLEAADYWQEKPAILSAGLGFDNIIGLPRHHPGRGASGRGIMVRRPALWQR
jgi:hypothetical protein